MDEIHDQEFSSAAFLPPLAARRAREPWGGEEGTDPRRTGDREEQLIGPPGAPRALRVQPLGPEAVRAVRDELQLLAALEVAGAAAAPSVLEIEDEGYVRETAPPVTRPAGRRCAEGGAPPTQERLALARAREQLDELLTALHSRGWVLGAPPGGGLGRRADGTVVVVDLHGLRRADGLSAQQEDRHWVDSVLQDQDRTLRRRVHGHGTGPLQAFAGVPEPDAAPSERDSALLDQAPAPAPAPAPSEEAAALPVPRRLRRRRTETLPHTSSTSSHARGGARRAGLIGAPARMSAGVREVLSQPRLRRTAVTSAVAVLLSGTLLALGIAWAGERGPGPMAAPPPAGAASAEPDAAPRIEDPWALAADLAGARHSYVTGTSDQPISLPGSRALAEDEQVRAAYEGMIVHGGGPVVHSAEIVQEPTAEGTAVLRAVTSTQEHELEAPDGTLTEMPATAELAVLLTLRWDGAEWRILRVEKEQASE